MQFKYKHKNIPGVEKGFETMIFGRQLPSLRAIKEFKEGAKSHHIGTKGRSFTAAFKEFLDLYKPNAYYVRWVKPTEFYSDDSVEVFYK